MAKELKINDELFARYEFGKPNNTLFLKTYKKLGLLDDEENESVLSLLIGIIEKKQINYIAYLNIN